MAELPNEVRDSQPTSFRRQGVYWILTIPLAEWEPEELPEGVAYIKGQAEKGSATSYEHWQMLVVMQKKCSLARIKHIFGREAHAELTRSAAADAYVWKDDTAIDGTRFELGQRPVARNSKPDWDRVWDLAIGGELTAIPSSIRVQHYRTLRAIGSDFAKAEGIERQCFVFWGPTGTGKSRTAWSDAGVDAYPKDPRTKFWCGYQNQQHVVIDEFRGSLDISHVLRWLDRYPVIVETKGGSCVLRASKIWITSNLHPRSWYPDLDEETYLALERRLEITQFL